MTAFLVSLLAALLLLLAISLRIVPQRFRWLAVLAGPTIFAAGLAFPPLLSGQPVDPMSPAIGFTFALGAAMIAKSQAAAKDANDRLAARLLRQRLRGK